MALATLSHLWQSPQRMGNKKKTSNNADAEGGVSVRIAPELRQRAKVFAAENNRSLKNVVDEAVSDYLAAKKRQRQP